MAADPYTSIGEADAFLPPVRDGVVDEGRGHAAIGPYDSPPRQVGRVIGRHDAPDDARARPEQLREVAVRHDATRWYEPHHLEHVVREGHRRPVSGLIAASTAFHTAGVAAASSTPEGDPGA